MDRRVAVVTGGAGFIGSHLCDRLLQEGFRVLALDNLITGSLANLETCAADGAFQFTQTDVSSPLDVRGRVDVVFHLASVAAPVHYAAHPVETLRVGSHGTESALRLAERRRARFVLASTSEVYGDPLVHPQPESYWGNVNPIGPRSMYDESKRFAEALTMAFRRSRNSATGIARIFNTYGPRMSADDGRAVPAFVDQAIRGEALTIAGDGTQTRSLGFVTDTVEALLRLAASDLPGPVNIGGSTEISIRDLALRIRDLVGSPSRMSHVPLPGDDPSVRRPDLSLARSMLGWEPRVSLDDGLLTTIESRRAGVRAVSAHRPAS